MMVFAVISIAPNLSAADHDRAVAAGPPYAETEEDYSIMLAETAWRLLDRTDVTKTFADTVRRLVHQLESRAHEVIEVLGESDYDDFLDRKRRSLPAIDEGIVRRELFRAAAAVDVQS